MLTKICTDPNCEFKGISQSVDNFQKNQQAKDGLMTRCKSCTSKRKKKNYLNSVGGVLVKPKAETEEERHNRRLESYKKWRKNNPDKVYANQYLPKNRINRNFSKRIRNAIKKNQPLENMLDYTLEELIEHLEKQFRKGMSWENYGKVWHIDHIKPIFSFNYKTKDDEDFKKCWALENLQPLFVLENLRKSKKIISSEFYIINNIETFND